LGLGYFAKEKADALTQVGLPDPAVLEVQQEKPAAEDVPVLEEQKPAVNAADVPQAPEQQ
jgi:preprotein translocase subunit SecG